MSTGTEAAVPEERVAWHAETVEEVFDRLDTDANGLSQAEAERRLEAVGPNEIREGTEISPLAIFVSQFQDVLIYLLVFAALLSLGVGLLPGGEPDYVDAGLILLILLANGIFGFVQDYQAERSIELLRKLSAPDATVLRDGQKRTVEATAVVPGDVVVLDQGDAVPADARLVDVTALETTEASLTGESTSVGKDAAPLDPATPLAERRNMVFMNTNAVRGRATAVVVETGMGTEVGGIVTEIQAADDGPTPFQQEVDALGRRIGAGVLGLIALIAGVQYLFTEATAITVLLTATTLAVAAVPEGLPAVVTLTLALGSRRMVAKNALVRRLSVVESLGSVDVVLTDKTGTLTENQMTVTRVLVGEDRYEVTGTGLDTTGTFRRDGTRVDADALEPVLRCGAICNNAERAADGEAGEFRGDPTEVALRVAAAKAGIAGDADRVREIPFSSVRKLMTVVTEPDAGSHVAYMKGAPETVLERCDRVLVDGEVRPLTDDDRQRILAANDEFATDALRVLGFAHRDVSNPDGPEDDLESGFVFLGLQGMIDPPRAEVAEAVGDCRDAGIRVVMVTGDNLETATAVGAQIGFDPERRMTGAALADLTDDELRDVVEEVEIFARVTPRQKVRITTALQERDHRVAMTGDGVNDAPGVRNADVGIAMGIRGTDVTKEASDMVLQDDNFATIRDAIAEGRGIFDNIRKFVNYLLSANAGEVLIVFLGVILGSVLFPSVFVGDSDALILTPVMLLWINLVTDGLPALALGADPATEGIMQRAPRSADEPVITGVVLASIATIGTLMTVTGLGLFFLALRAGRSLVVAQTLLFTFLVAVEVLRIQLIRSRYDLSALSNPWLVGAIGSSLVLQLVVLYTPANEFFDVVPLDATAWTWIGVAFAAFVLIGVVIERGISRYDSTSRPEDRR